MIIKKGLETEYKKYVEMNSKDGYSKAVVDAGEAIGNALDEGISMKEAHDKMYGHDLTGFMAGCVAQAIAHFHPKGEEFRVWWNAENGIKDTKTKGVVNPAIMTIKAK